MLSTILIGILFTLNIAMALFTAYCTLRAFELIHEMRYSNLVNGTTNKREALKSFALDKSKITGSFKSSFEDMPKKARV